MNTFAPVASVICLSAAVAGAWAHERHVPTPICIDLANNPTWVLAGNPNVTELTAVVTPASGTNLAYCQVDFTDVSLEGRGYGYMHGQTSKIRVRVGLPLNANDGGAGGVQGAWNGKIQSRGNGGFAGNVSNATPATINRYWVHKDPTFNWLDQIIPPNGHYNCMQRLFDETGGVSRTQDFYRDYVFPNATHCGGAGMTESVLFNALTAEGQRSSARQP